MSVNIGASNAGDQFYRYKMPPIQSKIEGRGNGIKTNVVNMVDVAKALARPASYTTKYFGCELGAQTKFDEKQGLAIVNGAHDAAKLAQMLEGFIKRFVQCFSCGNPETVINISKKETIHLKCKACGAVSDVDMRHKLCTFIVKNPPEKKGDKKDKQLRRAEKEREEEGAALDKAAEEEKKRRKEEKKRLKEEGKDGKKSKKDKKDKKDKKGKKGDEDNEGGGRGGSSPGRDSGSEPEPESDEEEEDDDDDTVWATDTSAAAMAARAREQLTDASASMVTVADELEKKASLEAQKQEDKDDAESGSDSEEEEDERIAKLRGYVAKHDAAETAAYLVGSKLGVDNPELGVHFLVEALFDEEKPMAPQVKAKKEYLVEACGADAKLQLALLCAVELYVTATATAEFKKLPSVLKELYDGDVVEEEVILKWGADPKAAKKFGVDAKTGEATRKQAEPFLEWLQQSDEESE